MRGQFHQRPQLPPRSEPETGVLLAAVRPGDRVLDVGCGTGQLTRLAAGRSATGSALGVDLSAPMTPGLFAAGAGSHGGAGPRAPLGFSVMAPRRAAALRGGEQSLREHLIAAAARLLDRRGPAGLTVRDVAREAGVADGVVYNHFADKGPARRAARPARR
ncbi:TetR family transcriptional regulator [Micromonospora sp. NPDC049282]|uniref:TetR/AcrR family transcriptional regulator n=1 Tax=Micromonospora sp. NPDC049282 TaxID=3364269 RepID=UPI0037156358